MKATYKINLFFHKIIPIQLKICLKINKTKKISGMEITHNGEIV
jgi:hypothetical protein